MLHIILIGIVAIVGGSIYFVLPLAVQLVLFVINAIVPDPIPYLDEIIMVGGILSKLKKLDDKIIWVVVENSLMSLFIDITRCIVYNNKRKQVVNPNPRI